MDSWSCGTPRPACVRHRFTEPSESWGIAFSADDGALFSSSDDAIREWDLTGQGGLFSLGRASDTAEYAASEPAPDGETLVRERLGLMWFVDNATGHETPRTRKTTNDQMHLFSPDSPLAADLARARVASGCGTPPLPRWLQPRFPQDSQPGLAFAPPATWSISPSRRHPPAGAGPGDAGPAREPIEPAGQRPPPAAPPGTARSTPSPGPARSCTSILNPARSSRSPTPGRFPPTARFRPLPGWHSRGRGQRGRAAAAASTSTPGRGSAPPRSGATTGSCSPPTAASSPTSRTTGSTLRDGRTGELLARLPLPGVVPGRADGLPTGRHRDVVAGVDGRTWTVDARPSAWLERACRTAGRNLTRRGVAGVLPEQALRGHLPGLARRHLNVDPAPGPISAGSRTSPSRG